MHTTALATRPTPVRPRRKLAPAPIAPRRTLAMPPQDARRRLKANLFAANATVARCYRACLDAKVDYDPFYEGTGPQPYETHPLFLAYQNALGQARHAKAALRSHRFDMRAGLLERFESFVWCAEDDDVDGGDW